VAVCDAFDAMTSDRSYRSAMSVEGALQELAECSGTQFDPMVVAAFRQVLSAPRAGSSQPAASAGHRTAARPRSS
jgi:HD-GYP domain-containing protein (c-di-GMP phosphodiesterase class II)